MEHYDLEVCGLKRELPFVKLSDGTAYASFVVISDTELITDRRSGNYPDH